VVIPLINRLVDNAGLAKKKRGELKSVTKKIKRGSKGGGSYPLKKVWWGEDRARMSRKGEGGRGRG